MGLLSICSSDLINSEICQPSQTTWLTVIESGKDKVRLGIKAPKDVKIIRSELYESREFNVRAAVNKVSIDFMNSFLEKPKQLNEIKQEGRS